MLDTIKAKLNHKTFPDKMIKQRVKMGANKFPMKPRNDN